MESNPFRVIPLLSDSSPRRGNLLFEVQGAHGRWLILEVVLEESRVVALVLGCTTCIRILDFNMCCIRVKS